MIRSVRIYLYVFVLSLYGFCVQASFSCSEILSEGRPVFSEYKFAKELPANQITPGQKDYAKHHVETVKKAATAELDSLEVPVIAVVLKSGTYYLLQDKHHKLMGMR